MKTSVAGPWDLASLGKDIAFYLIYASCLSNVGLVDLSVHGPRVSIKPARFTIFGMVKILVNVKEEH